LREGRLDTRAEQRAKVGSGDLKLDWAVEEKTGPQLNGYDHRAIPSLERSRRIYSRMMAGTRSETTPNRAYLAGAGALMRASSQCSLIRPFSVRTTSKWFHL
jgi:hypothetical protein